MFKTALVLLALGGYATAAEPIVKIGKACPFGYYANGSYCLPFPYAKPAIPLAKGCPVGWHVYNKYCVRN
jgi:hypothetical protein